MPDQDEKSVAELVFDVSERVSTLVREEVELAKAEVSEKVGKLLRGSVVGVAAGVFAFLALILIMEGVAWLLNEQVFDNFWAGFFVEAVIFLLIAALAGLLAFRTVKAGAPPVPEQAIAEAKLIKEAFESDGPDAGQAAKAPSSPPLAATPAPTVPSSAATPAAAPKAPAKPPTTPGAAPQTPAVPPKDPNPPKGPSEK
jgi:uncharacterized membrane protein YqjE